MHNWYGMETEAEFRRQEWQRMVEADARAALADSGKRAGRGWRLAGLPRAWWRSIAALRPSFIPLPGTRRHAAYPAK